MDISSVIGRNNESGLDTNLKTDAMPLGLEGLFGSLLSLGLGIWSLVLVFLKLELSSFGFK